MYAVIKTGGKQYQVAVGDKLKVELIPGDHEAKINFTEVLMLADGDKITVGNPLIADARVIASKCLDGRCKKVRIFKMRRRKHYQKHQGHRQYYTEVKIESIELGK
jgi:large subunit ribosomal protein L21